MTKETQKALIELGLTPVSAVTPDNIDILIHQREKLAQECEKRLREKTAKENLLDFTVCTFDEGLFSENWHVEILCKKLEQLASILSQVIK